MTDDPYWKELYTQASYGKMPKGFGYSNNFLEYNRGQKSYRTIIPYDPSGALDSSQEFFRVHGIISEEDIALLDKPDEDVENGWKQIDDIVKGGKKKAQFAEFVLREYCKEFCDTNKLTSDIKKNLYHTLFLAYKHKILNDVYVQDCKIVYLDGLTAQDKKFIYNPKFRPKQTKTKIVPSVEILDRQFVVRNRDSIDIPGIWGKWNVKRQTELGKKIEFMPSTKLGEQGSCTTHTDTC
jgi:hypothetical protein